MHNWKSAMSLVIPFWDNQANAQVGRIINWNKVDWSNEKQSMGYDDEDDNVP